VRRLTLKQADSFPLDSGEARKASRRARGYPINPRRVATSETAEASMRRLVCVKGQVFAFAFDFSFSRFFLVLLLVLHRSRVHSSISVLLSAL
jgi:hypothetical protein